MTAAPAAATATAGRTPNFSTKKSGMGLGLTIVNTIVADHNGMINVQDNQPQGVKFIIELPA